MNKEQIVEKIKETEEQLASLRAKLEEPEYPTLADAKPGDKLKNGCVVVHKFSDFRMALIAAPQTTERSCRWDKEFKEVFDSLSQEGFNRSQWFIPNVKQLQLAYKNCKEHFAATYYWSSTEASSYSSFYVSFNNGSQSLPYSKSSPIWVSAFSLVSY